MVSPMAIDRDPGESGFLSRWSQRKQALKKGEELAEPVVTTVALQSKEIKPNMPVDGENAEHGAPNLVVNDAAHAGNAQPEKPAQELPPAPTMKDVHDLTPQSDFKPFMRADVAPEVKNAAMKQLFKDPHFNVMDMMDIYVDDYSKPDPLPPEMLRKLAVTQFLGFWKEEEEEAAKKAAEEKAAQEKAKQGNSEEASEGANEEARESVQGLDKENVAQSVGTQETSALTEESQAAAPATAVAQASQTPNDHPDLQLQPDDASGREASLHRAG